MKNLPPLEESWIYLLAVTGALVVTFFTAFLYLTKRVVKEKLEKPTVETTFMEALSKPNIRSVLADDAERARNDLRVLDVERSIYSYVVRHLYEAHAENKLTEEERDRMVAEYRERMARINEAISRKQSILALYELEQMKEELYELFNQRFSDIEQRVKDLRERLGIEIQEAPIIPEMKVPPAVTEEPIEEDETEVEKPARKRSRRRPPPSAKPPKSEAEERIEKIREEVEKALERLGQIEV